MAQPKNPKAKSTAELMFSLPVAQDTEVKQSYSVNALPTRILHDGPMEFQRMYWNPKEMTLPVENVEGVENASDKKSQIVYFRGRKLFGKQVAIPASHKGLILRPTEETKKDLTLREVAMRSLESRRGELDVEAYEEEMEELRAAAARGELEEQIGVMEKIGELDDMLIWGHETVPAAEEGGLARLEEWHTLASAMHEY